MRKINVKSIKKYIAAVTAYAVLMSGFSVPVVLAEPTAVVGNTECSGAVLRGNYIFEGGTEGESVYQWYISDDFFSVGDPIPGANGIEFTASGSTYGKFLTFGVTPTDNSGNRGSEVFSTPVMQNDGYYGDFSQGLGDEVTCTESDNGFASLQTMTDGSAALGVFKPETDSFKSEARISIGEFSSSNDTVDVDLLVDSAVGTAEIFGVYSGEYGLVFKLYLKDGELYYRGGHGAKKAACGFELGVWNHLSMKIDCVSATVRAYINGSSVIEDYTADELPSNTETWRFVNDSFDNVASYVMNYGNGGRIFMKNLVATKANGDELAASDAQWLEDTLPKETMVDIELPSVGAKGSRIFYTSNSPYIGADGSVTRPPYGGGNADGVLTAYIINGSAVIKKEIHISVTELTMPPEAYDVSIKQNCSRPLTGVYTFDDPDFEAEGQSIYKWYVEDGENYREIAGENSIRFVPSRDYDGKYIKFGVTPINKVGVVGEEVLSEAYLYKYYETNVPTATLGDITITEKGFEAVYTYDSADYIPEGSSVIKWYSSARYDGEYTAVDGQSGTVFDNPSAGLYYKFSVTPTDAEGNMGEEEVSSPFTFCDYNAESAALVAAAIGEINFDSAVYGNLDFAASGENIMYTWTSSDESVIANDGTVTRPTKDEADVKVTVTVYVTSGTVTDSKKIRLTVKKYTEEPVVTDARLVQSGRPLNIEYTYADADGNDESGSIYKWYYKAVGESDFTLLDVGGKKYAPSQSMDGGTFYAQITPCDDSQTYGATVTTAEVVYHYVKAAAPTAAAKSPTFGIMKLIADYTYENEDGIDEGNSDFEWFVSDTLLGTYSPIDGEHGREFVYDNSYENKFVKYSVVPKDIEGNAGAAVLSTPTQVKFGTSIDFESGSDLESYNVTDGDCLGGSAGVDTDPTDADNHVLRLTRTSTTNNEVTRVSCTLPSSVGAQYMIFDADVYPSSTTSGTWEMLYLGPGGQQQAYKLYTSGTNLIVRGGPVVIDGKEMNDINVSKSFSKDTWHHIKVIFDYVNQVILETQVDGVVVNPGVLIPFRAASASITTAFSYMQNTTTGTNYIDNIQVTPVMSFDGLAKADADALSISGDPSAIIKNIVLPTKGSINGSNIIWKSSDESVITTRGKVTRPSSDEGDKTVTLTAYVINGNDYVVRTFDVTVMRILNDDEIAAKDLETMAAYDGMIIAENIKLPSKGEFGAALSWKSQSPSVISDSGAVVRGEKKQDVVMTVTAASGNVSESRDVTFTVVPTHGEDLLANGRVSASSQRAQYPGSAIIDGDYSTAWSSLDTDSAPFVQLDLGKIMSFNRLLLADRERTAAALDISVSADNISWNSVTVSGFDGDNVSQIEFATVSARYIKLSLKAKDKAVKINEIKVYAVKTDDAKVDDGIESITLPCGTTATSSFKLPQTLSDGTLVTWTSSNPSAIAISGDTAVVTRGTSDVQVTLTATVTSGGVSKQKSFVVLVPAASGSSGGGGGGGTGGGKAASGVTSAAGSYVPTTPTDAHEGFDDITSVPWAADAINSLAKIGVVTGTAPNTFEPNRNVAREEFAAFVYRGFGFDEVSATAQFGDVAANEWYYKCITQLASLGVISGTGNEIFGVGDNITRQDMAVIIYRAAKTAGINLDAAPCSFADSADIADYALEAIGALTAAGIINGVGGNAFNPNGSATRAEAAVIISRIISMSR